MCVSPGLRLWGNACRSGERAGKFPLFGRSIAAPPSSSARNFRNRILCPVQIRLASTHDASRPAWIPWRSIDVHALGSSVSSSLVDLPRGALAAAGRYSLQPPRAVLPLGMPLIKRYRIQSHQRDYRSRGARETDGDRSSRKDPMAS